MYIFTYNICILSSQLTAKCGSPDVYINLNRTTPFNKKKRRANIVLTGSSPGDIVLAVSGHNIRHHRNIRTHGVLV